MGGAKAGEFASRIAVEKITRLLPRSFKQSAVGLEAGFDDVLDELFDQIHRALTVSGRELRGMRGHGRDAEPVLVHPGLDVFRPHRRQPHLLPAAREGGIKQLSHDDTHVGWLFRNGKINEREARTHPRRNVLQKALGAGHSSSIRRSARCCTKPATSSCSAPTA